MSLFSIIAANFIKPLRLILPHGCDSRRVWMTMQCRVENTESSLNNYNRIKASFRGEATSEVIKYWHKFKTEPEKSIKKQSES